MNEEIRAERKDVTYGVRPAMPRVPSEPYGQTDVPSEIITMWTPRGPKGDRRLEISHGAQGREREGHGDEGSCPVQKKRQSWCLRFRDSMEKCLQICRITNRGGHSQRQWRNKAIPAKQKDRPSLPVLDIGLQGFLRLRSSGHGLR